MGVIFLHFISLSKDELWCFLFVSPRAVFWQIIILTSLLGNEKIYCIFEGLYLPSIKEDLSQVIHFYIPPPGARRIGLYIYFRHKFKISRVKHFKQYIYILLCNATIESMQSHKGSLINNDFSFGRTDVH